MFLGGGSGAFFTWRYMRRKSRAEAFIEEQNYYQEMLADMAKERDYYKRDRDEFRDKVDALSREFIEWRAKADKERVEMKMEIDILRRKTAMMDTCICGDMNCKRRIRVMFDENGAASSINPKEIEPNNEL